MTTLTTKQIDSQTRTNAYADIYRDLILTATLGQVEQASVWYHEAEYIASQVASNLNVSLEMGASVVSAFSPRERWASNVAKALTFSNGGDVRGLPNNLVMAHASLVSGFDALRGPKTNAFARAIAGDADAVVIDIWMMRAAGMKTDSPTKGQYNELSAALVTTAKEFAITPRTAQALVWIIVRGGAA